MTPFDQSIKQHKEFEIISVDTKVIENINDKKEVINNNTVPSSENIIATTLYKDKSLLRNNIDNAKMVDKCELKQSTT